MTIAHGIVVGGVPIPGTERVIRDSRAWWSPGTHDTRPRRGAKIRKVRGHWSAGHYRTGPGAGLSLFRAMESRKNDEGEDLHVSVHHSISADGLIWQHLDHETASIDVGHRPAILDGVSCEVMWPGTFRQAVKLDVEDPRPVARVWDGARVMCVRPTDEQLEAWRWLCDVVCKAHGIPRVVAPQHRLTAAQLARFSGVCEHGSLPDTPKIDACGLLMDATGYPAAR